MTLQDTMHEVHRLLGDIGCDHVTIERLGRVIRFEPHPWAPERYLARVDGSRTTSCECGRCFTIADVLADDWRIAP